MADEVPISKAVNQRLTNLALTRQEGSAHPEIKAEWKIPGWMKDPSNPARANWVDAVIDFVCAPDSSPKRVEVWQTPFHSDSKPLDSTLNADHYWVRGLEQGGDITETSNMGTELEKPYDRSRYYPRTSKKCTGVKVGVHGGNGHGADKYGDLSEGVWGRGPTVYQTFAFSAPQRPECSWTGWNEESNYRAEFAVNANPADEDEAENNRERYDTRYRVLRQDNFTADYAKRKAVRDWTAFAAEELTGNVPAPSNLRSLDDGQWVEFTLEAYSRGMAGDSATATATLVASRPARATIKSVKASSLSTVTGVVTVGLTIPNTAHRVTTSAKLQRLKDVLPDRTASQVAAMDGWEDVTGMVQIDEKYRAANWDTGFCDSVAAAYPSANRRTWYRVVTENELYFDDNAYMSTPVEARVLYHAQSAASSSMFVESLKANEDATAVKALLGWPSETPENTGTEISWSEHEDAWQSSEQPSTALADWKDAASQGAHANSASFTIYGLEPGKPYYVKARRYLVDENDETTYGPYATAAAGSYPFVLAQPPRDVRLSAPAYVPRGADVPLSWAFESEAPQTAWAVYLVDGGTRKAVASGEDAVGACTVPANMLSGDSATFSVSMTTGSEWAESQEAEVRFADPPSVSATFPTAGDPDYETTWPLLLEQPMQLYCSSDTGDDVLHVRVLSNGVSYGLPDRDMVQVEGEPVFDAWIAPTWLSDGEGWRTVVTLPDDVGFEDVGTYTWEVTAQNQESGLLSEPATGGFKVRWAHQAHMPGDSEVDVLADGRAITFAPAAPDNVADGDVFDLYRVTPDGVDLIASGLRYGSKVTDRYAPFGNGSYRVSTRTVDGDVAWRDFGYALKCANLRIDWDGRSVELPYNLVRQDAWAKDFEARGHLDGSVGGGWNPAVTRSASLSTDMIRLDSADDQRLVRELASYAGPAFVRLPNGSAYQADVQVSGLDESYRSGAVAVSLSATQVDLTDEYRIALPDVDTSDAGEYERREYGMSEVLYWGKQAPAQGDSFELSQQPSGSVLVELTASHDYYSDAWSVPNAVSGKTVTLGALGSDLRAFVDAALAEGGSVRLIARYDTEAQDA